MNYDYIRFATLEVYKECNINSFPIHSFEILNHYNIRTHTYSSLSDELRRYCLNYSNDALYYKDKICYNDLQPKGRIYFSLMHELGHVMLKHNQNHTPQMEQQANIFASNILAPRMAIHYAGCKNQNDVATIFSLTNEAASYAFDDYKRWRRRTLHEKMGPFDQAMYQHFFNKESNKFVYSIIQCAYCDELIYNSFAFICEKCNTAKRKNIIPHGTDSELLIAENQWLYRGL